MRAPGSPTWPLRGGESLAISLSLVLLLGIATWVLHKYAGLKLWHAVICLLFGFYLATTSFAPQIRAAVTSVIATLTGQH